MKLTVAIPTYNRNEILLGNLKELLPQIRAQQTQCRLVIIDNCSNVPVAESLDPLLSGYSDINYQIVRNKYNIGLAGNLLRCFEACETDWIWILGDDDRVKPDAVNKILQHADSCPDAVSVNFSSILYSRTQPFAVRGIRQFVDELDSFCNLGFISTNIYRIAPLLNSMRLGYHYAYSLVPHVALLIKSLNSGAMSYFSEQVIVDFEEPSSEQRWSNVLFAMGIDTVIELVDDFEICQLLANKVSELGELRLEPLVIYLILELRKSDYKNNQITLYFYDQICYRRSYFRKDIFLKLKIFFYRFMLLFPRIGYRMLEVYIGFKKGRERAETLLSDRQKVSRFERL